MTIRETQSKLGTVSMFSRLTLTFSEVRRLFPEVKWREMTFRSSLSNCCECRGFGEVKMAVLGTDSVREVGNLEHEVRKYRTNVFPASPLILEVEKSE